LPASLRAVRAGGHLTLVGLLSGAPADREAAARNDRGVQVHSIYVGSLRHCEVMSAAIAQAVMHLVVDRVFPFEAARQAYEHLQHGTHFGKIVIRV
jgi:NADPH:quinone reductase-like Zn-dependent oxidoreductase